MKRVFRDLTISRKLTLAVLIAFAPVVAANLFTLSTLRNSHRSVDAISAIRLPTHIQLGDIALDVSRSISAFYGFVLTGRSSFRERRAANWQSIERSLASFDALHGREGSEAQRDLWLGLRNQLSQLQEIQERIEDVRAATTTDLRGITGMIDQEMVPVARGVMDLLRGNPTEADRLGAGLSGLNAAQLIEEIREVERNALAVERMVAGVTLLSLGMFVFGIVLLTRSIARPVVAMASATNAIAERDYSVPIPALGARDEIGQLAAALAEFRERLARMDAMESAAKRQHLRESERTETIDRAILQFEKSAGTVLGAIGREAEALRFAAGQLAAPADVDAPAPGEASLADTVRQIAALAARANLVALNASIEASRAGEAGRSFALLAADARELASQSGTMTEALCRIASELPQAGPAATGEIDRVAAGIAQSSERMIGEFRRFLERVRAA